jgi:preprotein translocase subunit YajC
MTTKTKDSADIQVGDLFQVNDWGLVGTVTAIGPKQITVRIDVNGTPLRSVKIWR